MNENLVTRLDTVTVRVVTGKKQRERATFTVIPASWAYNQILQSGYVDEEDFNEHGECTGMRIAFKNSKEGIKLFDMLIAK